MWRFNVSDFSECPDVRLAVPDDVPGIMGLMRLACEEINQHPMDDEKVFAMVCRYYNKEGALIAVIGEPGFPVAYLLMIVDSLWYSKDYQLLELSLFVHPDKRKSNYAKQLMKFSKQASDGLDLDLTIGVWASERTEAKVRLYQRQFKTSGTYFTYRPGESRESA
jgi:GNAT superfamily N-acetyltransferase